ncbi:uncharacterized protein LOC134692676 [Mytilus trossulus]|uniref:uncharacterized protein LOC134692676 n=1 Tax=Mytilus trossulus TaxID=6551 RepID=UPI003003EA4C
MTSGHNLRSRIHKDWKKLCFGDSLPRLKKEPAASRVVLEETFKVERLIVKKFTPKEGNLYLVKWEDYPYTETTWEPQLHIDQDSLSEYFPKIIEHQRLLSAANALEDAIRDRLRRGNRNNRSVVRFDLDIFRYCFHSDKAVLLNSTQDFSKLPLSNSWYYKIAQNGTGQKIKFPILLTPKLRMRKIYVKIEDKVVLENKPIETLCVTSATCNFL